MAASADAASAGEHTPVLYQNVLTALPLRAAGRYIDGTVGAGGHAFGILQGTTPGGLLLGCDRDPHALQIAAQKLEAFKERVILRQGSYELMRTYALEIGWESVDGILLDLGLSSMQLDTAERGFSFQREGPLDMRFDPHAERKASDLVNQLSVEELAEILWRYGEENRSRKIARAIENARPLATTTELAQLISDTVGRSKRGLHPATKTFQALRIAVNDELAVLERGLEAGTELLHAGGRMVVISFHSLEDRIVKRFFRRESKDCICPPETPICVCDHKAKLKIITPKPIRPGEEEIEANPRSRSAKMRVAERLPLA
ncbi:MAG: 16S rRNA (cytosine(1402)-N(4))-methyltransferase RsmH [Anaerolineales bacterium]|jgi:16S rRNA (cytosine1402-N4)-methyltransferase